MEIKSLLISEIRRDGRTQCRTSIDPTLAEQYAQLIHSGIEFPPVRVWFDGRFYWLTDGFHRIIAAESAGKEFVVAKLHNGSLLDATWDSCGSQYESWTAPYQIGRRAGP